MLPVVKSEKRDDFLQIWEKWFVTENSVEDEKFPGKLKSMIICLIGFNIIFTAEWETRGGTFVALGNKMYQGFDPTSGTIKKSTKGIPHSNQYSMDTWLGVLLDESFPRQSVTINSLRLNQKKEMSRMILQRSSLSDIFLKMNVEPDKITCTPLMKNKKIL